MEIEWFIRLRNCLKNYPLSYWTILNINRQIESLLLKKLMLYRKQHSQRNRYDYSASLLQYVEAVNRIILLSWRTWGRWLLPDFSVKNILSLLLFRFIDQYRWKIIIQQWKLYENSEWNEIIYLIKYSKFFSKYLQPIYYFECIRLIA